MKFDEQIGKFVILFKNVFNRFVYYTNDGKKP